MTSPIRKYTEIVESLRGQIEAGAYRPGDRIPGENELSLRFSVSRPTAARAVRELVSAGLLKRRPGSGTYVQQPGIVDGSPGAKVFGLLVQGLGATEILDPICTEITRACQQDGSVVLWGDTATPHDTVQEVERLCDRYLDRGVDGVFFAPLEAAPDRQKVNVKITDALSSAGIAVVLLDRDILDFPERSQFDLVGIDNFLAGLHLGQHLIAAGRRRLAFLAKPHHPSTTDLRAAGCRTALHRADVDVDPGWQHSGDPAADDFVRTMLTRQRPDAVVCSNDSTAALLIQTLTRLGVSVPSDVAVAGFDDVRYSTLLSVPLTTMRQPCRGIARAAVHAMRDRIGNPGQEARQVLLTAEMVIRQSSAARS